MSLAALGTLTGGVLQLHPALTIPTLDGRRLRDEPLPETLTIDASQLQQADSIGVAALVWLAALAGAQHKTMQEELITSRIKAVLPDAEITLTTFDGVHYSAHIRSAGFAGKSRLEQHRTVMNALGDILGSNEIHALALKTEVAG